MIHVEDEHLIRYAKLFILLIGAASLLIGFIGLTYDYAKDLIIDAGNTGWALIGVGATLMVLALAGFVLIPLIQEHSRQKQLYDYYRSKYPDRADVDALVHDIREQLQVMQARVELVDQLTDAIKAGHYDAHAMESISRELDKQKETYNRIAALIAMLRRREEQTIRP